MIQLSTWQKGWKGKENGKKDSATLMSSGSSQGLSLREVGGLEAQSLDTGYVASLC